MVTKTKEKVTENHIYTPEKPEKTHIILSIICTALMAFTILLLFSANWYIRNYGETGFDSVMFTLLSNMDGTNKVFLKKFSLESVLPALLCSGVLGYLFFVLKIEKKGCQKIKYQHKASVSLLLSLIFLFCAGTKVNIFGYIRKVMLKTTIYEDYYVRPGSENITFPEKKRNLIYIFLESMETSFMSETEGGALPQNVMPELTKIAEENINFSHNEGVGGFLTPSGTGWTVAGMVSQTSGVPLKGSLGVLENNEYGRGSFLPGVISLSDVLNENGYKQALMVGSDSSFANRNKYFAQHKTDYIYDIATAKQDGIVDEDYYVWWGMEDEFLFEYAKDKIRSMANEKEPFCFTLLTVDTHFPDGYVCNNCKDEFNEQFNNVVSCASHQVSDFLKWVKKQKFYDNTTIVICGDHLSMDNQYITKNVPEGYDRRVYNCFINSASTADNCKNRTFTSLDIFPTVLAAMGCEIKGDRLGLGTNLFSEKSTIPEEMGYEEFNHKLMYSSNFYIKEFLIEKKSDN